VRRLGGGGCDRERNRRRQFRWKYMSRRQSRSRPGRNGFERRREPRPLNSTKLPTGRPARALCALRPARAPSCSFKTRGPADALSTRTEMAVGAPRVSLARLDKSPRMVDVPHRCRQHRMRNDRAAFDRRGCKNRQRWAATPPRAQRGMRSAGFAAGSRRRSER